MGSTVVLSHEVLLEEYEKMERDLGSFSRDETVIAIVHTSMIVLLIFQPWTFDKWFKTPGGSEAYISSGTIALTCGILLFMMPSQYRHGEALLTWKSAHEKVEWGIFSLIGGGYALAEGWVQSGLVNTAGERLAQALEPMSPLCQIFVVTLVMATIGTFLSSVATTSAMLPIVGAMTTNLVVNPFRLMLPATVAASFSFVLPMSSPANIIVFAKSRDLFRPLRNRDFIFNGCPIWILAIAIGTFLSWGMGIVVFQANAPWPQQLCTSNTATACVWMPKPAIINGFNVTGQACMLKNFWNGVNVDQSICALYKQDPATGQHEILNITIPPWMDYLM